MFELAHRPTASERDCPFPDGVRVFLIESERRVVAHCWRLLAQDAIPGAERRRLTRLASDAEAELQRLGA